MNEEEIVNKFKSIINSIYLQGFIKDNNGEISTLLKNLLDLYNEEKEERKKFEKAFKQRMAYSHELEKDLFENCSNYVISKAKIREKIEKYENMKKKLNKAKDTERIKAINERLLAFQEILFGE